MPAARFVGVDGTEVLLDVPAGQTLRQAALDNLVPGIIGECGGFATCGTCHVVVDERFRPLLPAPSEDEEIVLEGLLTPVTATSRLACQIAMTDELDGITVHVPESQG
ncbi:2Fe-2S iron-sulfur cluster-binding protein [Pseudonocardia humida]|uniref:2Fe-2S iron-sulfur cluster binding domain-containing protein n=1 Tax=Pseudonocardia humida TaxID=2800819 RepID=A0ABT0ZY71_9PSEU|nr:2Fe-2S iron-sulfur cluster-binding protein [Pseudonocardia humida]MCO1655688.1 2Fe-2S iron-sulfur cluster binding domain-containing protein [Pseudonocardia humida]